jgi:hypothetical protein
MVAVYPLGDTAPNGSVKVATIGELGMAEATGRVYPPVAFTGPPITVAVPDVEAVGDEPCTTVIVTG